MFTLSDASRETKEILKWGGIFLAGLMIFLFFLRLAIIIKNTFFPTISKPTVAFGKLQPQSFPENAVNENLTYSIDTLTGNLPNLSDQTRIYKMQPFVPDLLTVNKFQEKVMHTGFQSGYTAISDRIFEWKSYPDRVGVEKRIRVNIVNGNFTITSPYMSDSDILKGRNLPSIPEAIDYATNMLNNMQMMPDDIDLSKTKTNLFSIQNGSLVTSTSLSNSQIIEVNYYQKDINKLPVFYEKPNSSNISILIAGGPPQSQIVGANFIHQSILDQYSTYPIKTANQAFEELKKGNAYIASYFGKNTNISINNVFLVYYIGSQAQDFLMPVIVFEGSNGFFAYVPAVTDEWINK